MNFIRKIVKKLIKARKAEVDRMLRRGGYI